MKKICCCFSLISKNIVVAGLTERSEIRLAYAIGVAAPVSIYVNTFGTGVLPDEEIQAAVSEVFDFTPNGIIRDLELRKPVFSQTAAYGHFGRTDTDFSWERTNKKCRRLKRHSMLLLKHNKKPQIKLYIKSITTKTLRCH